MRLFLAVTAITSLLLTPCFAQEAEQPRSSGDLEVIFFNIGQGEATLIISPTGTTFLLDGGLEGKGNNVLISELNARGISTLDYICATHYHSDHVGGLDEVFQAGIVPSVVLDRGNTHEPNNQPYLDYKSTFASLRQTVPYGMVIDLGGSATLTCLSVDGVLQDGTVVNISGTAQEENSASITWLLEFGDFDLFLGGDLTGPSATSSDLEGPVSDLCGDVDVYRVNGHGGNKSTSQYLVDTIQPEFAVISAGSPNGFGHPRQEIVDRLNTPDRVIPVWCTSPGNGAFGYVSTNGHITLRTNGKTYSASMPSGTSFTALCDEFTEFNAAPGELVISEFHRNPEEVDDYYGEWIELTSLRKLPLLNLHGTAITNYQGETVVMGHNICLEQGESITLASDGLAIRNGGHTPAIALPILSLTMANDVGSLGLFNSLGIELERLDYTQSWPGGSGVSAERADIYKLPEAANFVSASTAYGDGDLGTPGLQNAGDITDWNPGGDTWVHLTTPPNLGGILKFDLHMPGEFGYIFQAVLSDGINPGMIANGFHLPINNDKLFRWSRDLPGWRDFVPAAELQTLSLDIPIDPALIGRLSYVSVATFNPSSGLRTWARPVPMQIWY